MEDKENWQHIRKGNSQLFIKIYNEHVDLLFSYGIQFCKDHQMIEDCIQTTFTELWDKRRKINIETSIKYYIIQAFRRRLFKNIQIDKLTTGEEEVKIEYCTPPNEELIIRKELENSNKIKLNECLNTLPKRQQEAIFHRYYTQLNNVEISEIMGIDVKGVYKLISNGLIRLRKEYFLVRNG